MRMLILALVASGCVAGEMRAEGFETPTWQAEQSVEGKSGWRGGAIISKEQAKADEQSLKIAKEQTAERGIAGGAKELRYIDLYVLPVYGTEPAETLDIGGAKIGFLREGTTGRVVVLEGEQALVLQSGDFELEGTNGEGAEWLRVTVRLAPAKGEWDLHVNGVPVRAGSKLSNEDVLKIAGGSEGAIYADEVSEGAENPLFADSDHDGMPDAEEKALGLDPYADDRDGDLDGDGVSNVQELFQGTSPRVAGKGDGAGLVGGPIIYVDNLAGNDGNTGNHSYAAVGADGPKGSIKGAMASAPTGATIVVLKGKGIYEEGSRGIKGKALTIRTVEPVTIR